MSKKSRPLPDVTAWAETVPAEEFSFGELEAHLLQKHDPILRALGRPRRDDAEAGSSKANLPLFLMLVGVAAVYLAPLIGLAAFLSGTDERGREMDGLDTDTALAVSRWCFWVAVLAPLYGVLEWWEKRSLETSFLIIPIFPLACAVPTYFIQRRRGIDEGYEWASAAQPVIITIVLSSLLLVAALTVLLVQSRRTPTSGFRRTGPPDEATLAGLIDRLGEARQGVFRDQRLAALDILREREVISGSQWQRADLKPLGHLYTLDD